MTFPIKNASILYFNTPPSPYYLESGISTYEPGQTHPNRLNLGVFDFILVKKGCLHIGEEQQHWHLQPGETLILLPNRYHYSVKPTEEYTEFYWIHFHTTSEWQESEHEFLQLSSEQPQHHFHLPPYTMHLPKSMLLPFPEQANQLLEKMNAAGRERESNAFWQRQQAFSELLWMLDRRQHNHISEPSVKLAEQVEHYIRTHYQSPISNEHLSYVFNYHYNYITRCMKQIYKVTPNEYLTRVRLEQAKKMLLHTNQSIAAIALQVGFANIPYFSNCFTKFNGISPSAFRNQYIK